MSTAHFPQAGDTQLTAIDAAFVQEAGRIGADIHRNIIHTSPWVDLTKQTAFPDGMGYQQQTLIYERALPTKTAAGNSIGVNWYDAAIQETTTTLDVPVGTGKQPLAGATNQNAGAWGGDLNSPATDLTNDVRSYINYAKKLKPYHLRKAQITAPKLHLEDLRMSAHRQDQLRAQLDLLTEATQYTWEERYREEYERVAANLISCRTSGTTWQSEVSSDGTNFGPFEDRLTYDGSFRFDKSGAAGADITPDAMISNKVLDKLYTHLIRQGASAKAYGRENGRPVFAIILSSEASYALQTEAGFRDDVRYNSSVVSDLIAPLGVEKSFRGYYHLNDDLAPRLTINSGVATRVLPYTANAGIIADNPAYDSAEFEVAFVHHQEVCEAQIPNPFSGVGAAKFNPTDYKGKFNWYNIQSEENPDRMIGYFRGVLASATKPIKTQFAYVIVYKRDANPAA